MAQPETLPVVFETNTKYVTLSRQPVLKLPRLKGGMCASSLVTICFSFKLFICVWHIPAGCQLENKKKSVNRGLKWVVNLSGYNQMSTITSKFSNNLEGESVHSPEWYKLGSQNYSCLILDSASVWTWPSSWTLRLFPHLKNGVIMLDS